MFDGQPKELEFYDDDAFIKWRKALPQMARRKLDTRLTRLESGNPGPPETGWKSLGEGVYELKIHEGIGYRVYFAFSGEHIVLLLCGGTKPTQDADIERAKKLWAEWQKERQSS